jgi:hypothetical protein
MFILDASVIISFYREMAVPDLIHLLAQQHKHRLIVPSRVYAEIKGESFTILTDAINKRIVTLYSETSSEECNNLKIKHPALSNGEIEAMRNEDIGDFWDSVR